jgi:hypothetical protein
MHHGTVVSLTRCSGCKWHFVAGKKGEISEQSQTELRGKTWLGSIQ